MYLISKFQGLSEKRMSTYICIRSPREEATFLVTLVSEDQLQDHTGQM
jgi:hypothetical protein